MCARLQTPPPRSGTAASLLATLVLAGVLGLVSAPPALAAFAPPTTYPAGNGARAVTVGDLDGDGWKDLAVANQDSNDVSILFNDGHGRFQAAIATPAGTMPRGIAAGDLDGDGDLDLLVAAYGADALSVLLNDGSGVFAPAVAVPAGDGPRDPSLADLDDDGDLDAIAINELSDNVSVLLNDGHGVLTPGWTVGAGDAPRGLAVGDLDLDGDPDAVVSNSRTDNVSILLNDGAARLAARGTVAVGDQPRFPAAADLDADGDLDLAVPNSGSASVSVVAGDGRGGFAGSTSLPTSRDPQAAVVGDLDADGDADLAVANYGSRSLSLLAGDGAAGFALPTSLPTASDPLDVATADLDGDGDLDLVTAHFGGDEVSVIRGLSVTRWRASAEGLQFPAQPMASLGPAQAFTLTNVGDAELRVARASLRGPDAHDVLLSADGCLERPVAPGASCTLTLRFAPSTTGARRASLVIHSNGPERIREFPLSGDGLASVMGPESPRPEPAEPPRAGPASSAAPPRGHVSAWFERAGRRATVVSTSFGRRVRIRGRLADHGRRPIAGATLRLLERTSGRPWREVTGVRTRADGRFTGFSRVGPSRVLRFVYCPAGPSPCDAAPQLIHRVRAPVTLQVIGTGRTSRLSGQVLGGHVPRRGAVVQLQVRAGERWSTFARVRSSRTGRFAATRRSRRAPTRSIRFRARVPRQTGLPFLEGVSSTVVSRPPVRAR